MNCRPKQVAVFGATGSIGTNTLEVIAHSAGRLRAIALSGHSQLDLLLRQARQFQPRWLIVTDPQVAARVRREDLPAETELLAGSSALERVAGEADVDIVVAAIVGSAGLPSTWEALRAGKTVALANKETLVVGGQLVTDLAAKHGGTLLPVDSEHSAVFQALQAGRPNEVERLILTASGGPFRTHTREQMAHVTVADALAHPTWNMGAKISIDSATMMNKALEIIEARWLFGISPDRIEVVIHPQSVIHSMVEFADGAVVAQLSPPDMKLPIHYALHYPERGPSVARKMDWRQSWCLEFSPPDRERFPALDLGAEVASRGGTAGAIFNAANEAAVAHFLDGKLEFMEIVRACRQILDVHNFDPAPSLEDLLRCDRWARQEVARWIGT